MSVQDTNKNVPSIMYYETPERGCVKIDDLTREEAIEALKETYRLYQSARGYGKEMSALFWAARRR